MLIKVVGLLGLLGLLLGPVSSFEVVHRLGRGDISDPHEDHIRDLVGGSGGALNDFSPPRIRRVDHELSHDLKSLLKSGGIVLPNTPPEVDTDQTTPNGTSSTRKLLQGFARNWGRRNTPFNSARASFAATERNRSNRFSNGYAAGFARTGVGK